MNRKSFNKYVLVFILATLAVSCNQQTSEPIEQTQIARIEQMPSMPSPYKIIDWKAKALGFDSLVYDLASQNPYGPFIWIDSAKRNLDQVTYGLYTVIHDVRQGPKTNNGEFHESLTSLEALISAGLLGIDKTNQHGFNYVKMVQNYFNTGNHWNIVMNNTCPEVALNGGGYGRDWWYDVFPNVLYYAVADLYPGVENQDQILLSVANQFYRADSTLNGNYNYSYFDYSKMKGVVNNIPLQQDAAGGHSYVLLNAYRKFKEVKYLEGAMRATEALEAQKESRFYEILLPFGAYTAAVLNAEQDKNYNVKQLLDWTFDGCQSKDGRFGWGVIAEKWGEYDVHGLQGSITDGGGYAFFMNSVVMSWPLVPMVKYEPQFARAIGKWMLNNVNASRLFYPDQVSDKNQWLPELKDITGGLIGYEGVRKADDYNKPELKGVSPVSLGDGPKWAPLQPKESMFSLYSTAIAGVFGAMVETTDVEGVLALDCNVTDFYAQNPFPTKLYYNPHQKVVEVSINTGSPVDLYDIVAHKYLGKNLKGVNRIRIGADQAVVIVQLPVGSTITKNKNRYSVNSTVFAYK